MRYPLLLIACLALTACTTRSLRCEGPLQPINPPPSFTQEPSQPPSNNLNGVGPGDSRSADRAGHGGEYTESAP
jgi:hypothetical protein